MNESEQFTEPASRRASGFSITRWAIEYRSITILATVVLMLVGVFAIQTLPRREDPKLSARFTQVVALFPGATALQVEELLTERLERELREIDDVAIVSSTSRPGISVLTVEAADAASDLEKFADDIRERVDDARPDLPRGVTRVIVNDRFAETAAMIFAVTFPDGTDRQREVLATALRDRLRRIPQVGEANLLGEQQETIRLDVSLRRLSQYGAVLPDQIAQAVANANVLSQTGGSARAGDARLPLEPTGEIQSIAQLANLVVARRGDDGQPIFLRDVAEVRRTYADPSPFVMRVNGQPTVGVSLTQRDGGNVTSLGERINSELTLFRSTLPAGALITTINDLPRSVERRIGEFVENLGAGVLLIVVVMYLFMGARAAFIVGGLMPVTILGTFVAMYFVGRDIQQMSIAALIIALGLVVDNSIVVIDNIEKKLSEAKLSREEAAIQGTDELFLPLLTSNLTTVASFAPLIFISGGVGEFIKDLGLVTALATLVSLLLNYTVTPLVAVYLLRATNEKKPNIVRRGFARFVDGLRWAFSGLAARGLRRPVLTVGIAFGLLVLSVFQIGRLDNQFFPMGERDQLTIDVWLPEGRDIGATVATAARVESIAARQKGVRGVVTYAGQGGPRFYYNIAPEAVAPNYAQIVVNTESIAATKRIAAAIQRDASNSIANARVTVRLLEQGPPIGAPIAVRVEASEIADLRATGNKVKAILAATPGATSVHDSFGEPPLAITLNVNEDRAGLLGWTSDSIARTVKMAWSGQIATYLRDGDREIPVELRLRQDERTTIADVLDIYLPTTTGVTTPLRQAVSIELSAQESRITRRNSVRTLTVSAFSDGTRLPSAILKDATVGISALKLPQSVTIGYGGEAEEISSSFGELLLILGLSLVANLLLLVAQFNSLRVAIAVLTAVPLGLSGAVLGLSLADQPFGFMAFLGITSLAGVVTNHAIVLFEYALQERNNGVPLADALVIAGKSRLRPILLTVVLSIGGLIPQAVNGGNLWPPMAWSLITGLLGSLALTLVVVPSFYALISGRGKPGKVVHDDIAPLPARNSAKPAPN